ncbi:MAG: hypothetical protein VZR00_07810 [Lachnospiraceae bacterium]|jgi:hypothetical protein|nr:hypothetical protein [Lachnospiraceae bacterium]
MIKGVKTAPDILHLKKVYLFVKILLHSDNYGCILLKGDLSQKPCGWALEWDM